MEKKFENTIELHSDKSGQLELVNNKELIKYIKFTLNKEQIEEDDLKQIEEIILDGKTIIGKENAIYFDEIQLFPCLRKISIKNAKLSDKDMQFLKEIESISFRNCKIENIENLTSVKTLELKSVECQNIEKISNLKNLEYLEIAGMNIDSFEFVKNLEKLKTLKLKNNSNFSMAKINFFLPIEYLSVEGIEKLEIDIIDQYTNLKTLSIDIEKEDEWKEKLQEIKSRKIKIYLNDIYEY